MKTKATYDAVVAAISQLKEAHQEPTLDAILLITGGSKGTIHKHWNRYKEAYRPFQAIEEGLSSTIQNAIMKEIASKTNEAKSQLEKALSEEKALSASLAHSNEQQENSIHDLQAELQQLGMQQASIQGKYEQADKDKHNERQKAEQVHSTLIERTIKLDVSENTVQQLKKQTTEQEQQLKQYQEKNHLFEKEAAVALQQVANLSRQLEEQEDSMQQQASMLTHAQKTNNKLNSEIKKLEKANAQAEQAAVIAEIKLEQSQTG